MFDDLTEDNFILYAAHNYDNPSCTGIKEFHEDLNAIRYIKRLFNRYVNSGELRCNLVICHLTLLYNVFDTVAMTRMLFMKIEEEYWSLLKPFLLLTDRLPETIDSINSRIINTTDIELNQYVVGQLRGI